MSSKIRTVETVLGKLKIISFRKFIQRVQVLQHYDTDDTVKFNTLLTYGSNGNPFFESITPPEDTANYRPLTSKLIEVTDTRPLELVLKDALFKQGIQEIVWNDKLENVLEEITVRYVDNFGDGELLVRVDNRVWMLANPNDFRIYNSGNKYTLVCQAIGKSRLYNIQKITEDEAIEASDNIMSEFRKKMKMDKGSFVKAPSYGNKIGEDNDTET